MMTTKPCAGCITPSPCTVTNIDEFTTPGTLSTLTYNGLPWVGDAPFVTVAGGIACSPAGPQYFGQSYPYINDPCLNYCAQAEVVNGNNGGFSGIVFRCCPCPIPLADPTTSQSCYKWDIINNSKSFYYIDCVSGYSLLFVQFGGTADGDVMKMAMCGNNVDLIHNGVTLLATTLLLNTTCQGRGITAAFTPTTPPPLGGTSINGSCTENFGYQNQCGGCCP